MIRKGDMVVYQSPKFGAIYGTVKEILDMKALFVAAKSTSKQALDFHFPDKAPMWIELNLLLKPQLIPFSR